MSNQFNDKNYFLFLNTGDWVRDQALNACSLAAQGLWIRLLCHMWDSEKVGYLIVNDNSLDKEGIQNMLKMSNDIFDGPWNELVKYGVIKKDSETDAYYSKRMVKDYKKHLNKNKSKFSDEVLSLAQQILKYLSKKTEKEFSITDEKYIKLISDKLSNGYKPEDFISVIDVKFDEWFGDKKMEVFLRPSTLFGDKFGDYLSQVPKKTNKTPIRKSNPYNDMMK